MIKTLIGIPIHKKLDDKAIRLLDSIYKYTSGDYRLYLPISDRSYSVQCNDCIKAAKDSGCDYLCLIDADAFFDEKSIGWLQKLEAALDTNKDYGLLMWSNDFKPNCDEIQYGDESQQTPYIASILCFYRLSNNILLDEDYLYHQSADPDWTREHRRQKVLTGYLPSIHINHLWDDNSNNNPYYECWKLRNEKVFKLKWNTICHEQNWDENCRNKWRGVYGRTDINNLEDYTDQYKQIVPYFQSTLFNNDCEYIKRNKLKAVGFGDGYYSEAEEDPANMPQDVFMKLLDLNHD
jgi:hypothetical protein